MPPIRVVRVAGMRGVRSFRLSSLLGDERAHQSLVAVVVVPVPPRSLAASRAAMMARVRLLLQVAGVVGSFALGVALGVLVGPPQR